MSVLIFIGTSQGLSVYENLGDSWKKTYRTLESQEVTGVIAREGVILAGSRQGVVRSEDKGQSWEISSHGLEIPYVRWLAYHPEVSDLEFAGTEPAGIFISRDGGGRWQSCPDVTRLRDRYRWSLPYSPEAGCIRGFAFHGKRIYAAAEVGGVLRSDDGGRSWVLANGSSNNPPGTVHTDLHSVVVHPSSPELVYAPTGGGFYRSREGGASWERHYDCYCRAVWVDPEDTEHIILGPADSVDRGGRIEQSRDGGMTWQPANSGLNTPWSRHMVERFYQIGDELVAVLSNGEILAARLDTLEWRKPATLVKNARAVAWLYE